MYRVKNMYTSQMRLKVHKFEEPYTTRIKNSMDELKRISPSRFQNLNFRTTNQNAWWMRNPTAVQNVDKIKDILLGPLSYEEKRQIKSVFMKIREVSDITEKNVSGNSYINRQTLHINFETHPNYGEAFKQIIYYVDTPKYGNGRIANMGNRGQLLVRTLNGTTTKIITPEKGQAVYFNPTDVFHEVLSQTNSNQNVRVDRKMIIMMLYKNTQKTNKSSLQIRNYKQNFPRLVRSLAGHIPRPSRNNRSSSLNKNMERLTLKNSRKRKRN